MADLGLMGYAAWAGLGLIGLYFLLRTAQELRRLRKGPAHFQTGLPRPVTPHSRALFRLARVTVPARLVGLLGAGVIWSAAPVNPPFWLIVVGQVLIGLAAATILLGRLFLFRATRW